MCFASHDAVQMCANGRGWIASFLSALGRDLEIDPITSPLSPAATYCFCFGQPAAAAHVASSHSDADGDCAKRSPGYTADRRVQSCAEQDLSPPPRRVAAPNHVSRLGNA